MFHNNPVDDANVERVQVYTALEDGEKNGKIGLFFQTNRPIIEITNFQSSKIGLTGHNFYVQLTVEEAKLIASQIQECIDALGK